MSVFGEPDTGAIWWHARIKAHYEAALKEVKDGEALVVEVLLSDGRSVIAGDFTYDGLDMLMVKGTDKHGRRVVALVQLTSVQVLFTLVPKSQLSAEPKRVGFKVGG